MKTKRKRNTWLKFRYWLLQKVLRFFIPKNHTVIIVNKLIEGDLLEAFYRFKVEQQLSDKDIMIQ